MTMPKGWKPTGIESKKENTDPFNSKKQQNGLVEKIDEKRWLMDQIKYNLQFVYDSVESDIRIEEKFVEQVKSSYGKRLNSIVAAIVFIATISIGITSTNTIKFSLEQVLGLDFIVGGLLYIYFFIIRTYVLQKLWKVVNAYYLILSRLNLSREYIVLDMRPAFIYKTSIKEMFLINDYIILIFLGRFELRDVFKEILSASLMTSFHAKVNAGLSALELTIANGGRRYQRIKNELPGRIYHIDQNMVRFAFPVVPDQRTLLKKYDDEISSS